MLRLPTEPKVGNSLIGASEQPDRFQKVEVTESGPTAVTDRDF
jgi:hypothetical protein